MKKMKNESVTVGLESPKEIQGKNINTNSIDIESSKKYSNVNEVLTEIGLEEYIDKFSVGKNRSCHYDIIKIV